MALVLTGTDARAFSLDDVAARAEKLAAAPYQKPNASLPKTIKALREIGMSIGDLRGELNPCG